MKALSYTKDDSSSKQHVSPYIPDFFADSITEVDYALLRKLGVRQLFFDLDQTLRRPYSKGLEDDIIDFFVNLQERKLFENIALVSNNNRNLRRYAEPIGARIFQPFWKRGRMIRKPSRLFYERVLTQLDAKPEETVMIGDKIRLDIAGANRLGMYTVLIAPRGPDYWFDKIIFARKRERRILRSVLPDISLPQYHHNSWKHHLQRIWQRLHKH